MIFHNDTAFSYDVKVPKKKQREAYLVHFEKKSTAKEERKYFTNYCSYICFIKNEKDENISRQHFNSTHSNGK
jgi:hypothetical protein